MRGVDVRHLIVQYAGAELGAGRVRAAQHQAYPAAVEEREAPRRAKQQRQAEHVGVPGHGAVEVGDGDGDLTDTGGPVRSGKVVRHGSFHLTSARVYRSLKVTVEVRYARVPHRPSAPPPARLIGLRFQPVTG